MAKENNDWIEHMFGYFFPFPLVGDEVKFLVEEEGETISVGVYDVDNMADMACHRHQFLFTAGSDDDWYTFVEKGSGTIITIPLLPERKA